MDCKIAEYWISLYIDQELDDEAKNKLMEHMNQCGPCREYLDRCLEMDQRTKELFEKKEIVTNRVKGAVMGEITKKDTHRREKNLKTRKALWGTVIAAALLLCIIPINGRSVMAYVNDWVKSLTIEKVGLIVKIEDGDAGEITPSSGGTIVKSERNLYRDIDNLLEDVKGLGGMWWMPDYLPEGYDFKYVLYERYLSDFTYDYDLTTYVSRYSKLPSNLEMEERLEIAIRYYDKDHKITKATHYVYNEEGAKVVSVGEEEAFLVKKKIGEDIESYELHHFLNQYGVKLEVTYKGYELNDTLEGELCKVAEGLVLKIERHLPEREIEPIPEDIIKILKGEIKSQ